jgi:hypothetical protein
MANGHMNLTPIPIKPGQFLQQRNVLSLSLFQTGLALAATDDASFE